MRLSSIRRTRINDFFGVTKLTGKDISGYSVDKKLPFEKIEEKYEPLIITQSKLVNEEKLVRKNFGTLRYDCDNVPKTHGQYEPNNPTLVYDSRTIKDIFEPDQESETKETLVDDILRDRVDEDVKQEQCESTRMSLQDVLVLFKRDNPKWTTANQPPLTFQFSSHDEDAQVSTKGDSKIYEPSDNSVIETKIKQPRPGKSSSRGFIVERQKLDQDLGGKTEAQNSKKEAKNHKEEPKKMSAPSDYMYSKEFSHLDPTDVEESTVKPMEMPQAPEIKTNKKPMNAMEYLKQVKSSQVEPTAKGIKHRLPTEGNIKMDSTGNYIYTSVVPDWFKMRKVDAIDFLKSSIIYDNYDLTIINKPYGISSHDERQGEKFDVNSLMQELAKSMKMEKFYLAHRLDKTTSGVLVFARSQVMAKKLNKLFKADLIKKTYWCITRGVPNPPAGIIDIPIGTYTVAKRVRSCLVPESWPAERQIADRYREARRAVTEYSVRDQTNHVALVEVKPRSGVKHQIRCHMSHALSCPIIGDHKYSDKARFAPQKLPGPVLHSLRIRQQKVRTLPICLHSHEIVIPDVKPNGENLFVSAKVPDYFRDIMKKLGLKEID